MTASGEALTCRSAAVRWATASSSELVIMAPKARSFAAARHRPQGRNRLSTRGWTWGHPRVHPRADDGSARGAYGVRAMIWLGKRVWRFFASSNWSASPNDAVWIRPSEQLPPEIVFLRMIGLGWLVLICVSTGTTRTQPAPQGRGLAVTLAFAALLVSLVVNNPRSTTKPTSTRLAAFAVTT